MKHSESLIELAKAMAKAQPAIEKAFKGKDNPYYKSKYADLTAVWDACESALHDNGFSVLQPMMVREDGQMVVETLLLHVSGEWIYGETLVKTDKPGPQGLGSAQTYARRYGLAAMVGVCPDEDDDAEGATNRADTTKPNTGADKAAVLKDIIGTLGKFDDKALSDDENKKVKKGVCKSAFGTEEWADVKAIKISELKKGLTALREMLKMKEST
jgi:hypothetical protein